MRHNRGRSVGVGTEERHVDCVAAEEPHAGVPSEVALGRLLAGPGCLAEETALRAVLVPVVAAALEVVERGGNIAAPLREGGVELSPQAELAGEALEACLKMAADQRVRDAGGAGRLGGGRDGEDGASERQPKNVEGKGAAIEMPLSE